MESLKLKSNDGEIIIAKRSIINQSSVLQKSLEELEAAGEKHAKQCLSIPEADGNCLRKIIEWMDHQKETPPPQTEEKDSEDDAIPNNQEQLIEQNNSAANAAEQSSNTDNGTWNRDFFLNFQNFCVLVYTADRLRVQSLVDAAVSFLIEWKQGKNTDDIRELIENGATTVRSANQEEAERVEPPEV